MTLTKEELMCVRDSLQDKIYRHRFISQTRFIGCFEQQHRDLKDLIQSTERIIEIQKEIDSR